MSCFSPSWTQIVGSCSKTDMTIRSYAPTLLKNPDRTLWSNGSTRQNTLRSKYTTMLSERRVDALISKEKLILLVWNYLQKLLLWEINTVFLWKIQFIHIYNPSTFGHYNRRLNIIKIYNYCNFPSILKNMYLKYKNK